MTNLGLIEDRRRKRERTEIEELGIDQGLDLGALGAVKRGFKQADWVFFIFKNINKTNPHADYTRIIHIQKD